MIGALVLAAGLFAATLALGKRRPEPVPVRVEARRRR